MPPMSASGPTQMTRTRTRSSSADDGRVAAETRVVVKAESPEEREGTLLAVESLRAFGGTTAGCEVWAFGREAADPAISSTAAVTALPLEIDDRISGYPFAAKVAACAAAEERALEEAATLVFLSASCLVVGPPSLLTPAPPMGAAFRPVHIRNVGSRAASDADAFWSAIYDRVGEPEACFTVESLVGSEVLRPYFNTHLFAVDPAAGVLGAWHEHFTALVSDSDFQAGPCKDEEHKTFLHQAILSALAASVMGPSRIRLLPVEYSYPLHLHDDVPRALRPGSLEELVCPVYEGRFEYPWTLAGIEVSEPLASWLAERRTP